MKQVTGVALVLLVLAIPPMPAEAAEAQEDLDRLFDDPTGHHVYDVGDVRYYAATLRLTAEERATGASPALLQKLERSGLSIAYIYHYIAAVGVIGTRESLTAATQMAEVSAIELAPIMEPSLNVSARAIKARASAEYPGEDAGTVCGQGIAIAVLDTGVDDGHDALFGKFVAGVDVSNTMPLALLPPLNEGNPDDDNLAFGSANVDADAEGTAEDPTTAEPPSSSGAILAGLTHGTHVSGIAMGTGGATGVHNGVAPCAKLVDVKVLTGLGVGVGPTASSFQNPFGAQAGIEWVLDYNAGKTGYGNPGANRVRVINLSISAQCSDAADSKETALDTLVNTASDKHDVVVVAAAGNCGALGIRAPGTARSAITVGALNDHGTVVRSDDTAASFSGRPNVAQQLGGLKKPDVAAPGVSIWSAQGAGLSRAVDLLDPMGFGFLVRQIGDTEAVTVGGAGSNLPMSVARLNAYHPLSGTSMSAPHVAGMAALILEAEPHLSARQVKQKIMDSAVGTGSWAPAIGWGSVDAYAALAENVGSAEGAAPDVAILEPRTDTQVPPSCTGNLRILVRANSGSLSSVTLQVDDAPEVNITADLDAQGRYSRPLSLTGTHEFRVRAVNSYGRVTEDATFAAGCQGLPGTRFPAMRATSADRVIAHLTAGTTAGIVAPDGKHLFVRYVPAEPDAEAAEEAASDPNAAEMQDALAGAPIVATLQLNGSVTARYAQSPSVAVDPALLQVFGGTLVDSPVDGTWILKTSQRRATALVQPAGIQATIAGKTFDNVASATSCPTVSTLNSEPIEGTGEGAAAGDPISPVKLWNWHAQSKPRYDASCAGTIAGVAGTSAPEESPYQTIFFPQEAVL